MTKRRAEALKLSDIHATGSYSPDDMIRRLERIHEILAAESSGEAKPEVNSLSVQKRKHVLQGGRMADFKPEAVEPPADERLAEIAARVEKASKGPWSTKEHDIGDETYCIVPDEIIRPDGKRLIASEGGLAPADQEWTIKQIKADAEFIAHSRTDIPYLLQALSRAGEQLKEYKAAWKGACDGIAIERRRAEKAEAALSAKAPQMDVELCGEVVAHLIAGASWFPCALPKGHDGDQHRAAGNCFKHGKYLGNANTPPQCPHWPDCISGPEHQSQPVPGKAEGKP